MHIQRNRRVYRGSSGVKVYESVLLRQCYYEGGKTKQKTIANLSSLPEHVIRAIELSIKKDEVYYKLGDLNFEDAFSHGTLVIRTYCLSLPHYKRYRVR